MPRALLAGSVALLADCAGLPQGELPTQALDQQERPLPPDPGPVTSTPGEPTQPTPTPAPGSDPETEADPTPEPTPAPTPTPPVNGSCNLAPHPDPNPTCFEETPSFEAEVAAAQERVFQNRPDLFSGATILDQDLYVQEVARVLRVEFGLCAEQGGPPDEVAVKITNDWNDQYDIVIGSNFTAWTNYTVTCRPARF